MQVGNNIINPYIPGKTSIKQGKIAFKGDFEDIIELSKKIDSPNEIQLASRKFLGPKRTIEPSKEKLQALEAAIKSNEVKEVWKSFFNMITTVWKQVIK